MGDDIANGKNWTLTGHLIGFWELLTDHVPMILQSYTAMIALIIFRPAINFDCFSHCCFWRCSFVDFVRSLALHPRLAEKCIDAVKQQCGELLENRCTLKKCPTVSSPRRHVNAFDNGHDLESRKNHLTIFVWCGSVFLFDQWIALRGGREQSRTADSCSVSGPAQWPQVG